MSAVGEAFATEGANAATEKKVETFVGATKLGDKKDQDVIDQVKQNCADAKKKVEDKEKEISDIDVKINRTVTTSAVGTSVTGFVMTATTKINDPEAYNKYTEEKRRLQEELKQLKEAKDKSNSGKTAYNGKGISVGYLDKDDYYQYQVLRFYK